MTRFTVTTPTLSDPIFKVETFNPLSASGQIQLARLLLQLAQNVPEIEQLQTAELVAAYLQETAMGIVTTRGKGGTGKGPPKTLFVLELENGVPRLVEGAALAAKLLGITKNGLYNRLGREKHEHWVNFAIKNEHGDPAINRLRRATAEEIAAGKILAAPRRPKEKEDDKYVALRGRAALLAKARALRGEEEEPATPPAPALSRKEQAALDRQVKPIRKVKGGGYITDG